MDIQAHKSREEELDPLVVSKLNGNHLHNKAQLSDFNESDYVHTFNNENINGDKTFKGNVVIEGNLTIQGTNNNTEVDNLKVRDTEVVLNDGETGDGVSLGSAGIRVKRGTQPDAILKFDENDDKWKVGIEGQPLFTLGEIYHIGTTPPTNKKIIWINPNI